VYEGITSQTFTVSSTTPTSGTGFVVKQTVGTGITKVDTGTGYGLAADGKSYKARLSALTADSSAITYDLYKGTDLVDTVTFNYFKCNSIY
jgi:hypothetical protein